MITLPCDRMFLTERHLVDGGNILLQNNIHDQLPIVYPYIAHEHAQKLGQMDAILRRMPVAGFSYQELAFHLAGSRCYRAYCGLSSFLILRQ